MDYGIAHVLAFPNLLGTLSFRDKRKKVDELVELEFTKALAVRSGMHRVLLFFPPVFNFSNLS